MIQLFFFNKSAPDITDFVFLVIGILLTLLIVDWLISYLKRKYREQQAKAEPGDTLFEHEIDESAPVNPPE